MPGEARQLPMFPLSAVLFPGALLPLHVFEPRYRAMTQDCLAADGCFGVVLIDRGSEVGGGDHRVTVGTVAQLVEAHVLPDGRYVLLAQGTQRLRVARWLDDAPYPRALVEALDDESPPESEILERARRAVRQVRALLSEFGDTTPLPEEGLDADPEVLGWQLCGEAALNLFDGQRLLESSDPAGRLELLCSLCEARTDDLTRLLSG
jgi:Lon protease-like protein